MIHPDRGSMDKKDEVQKEDGSLKKNSDEDDKLMHTVLEDDQAEKDGQVLNEATNKGFSFSPDVIFDKLTSDYKSAKELLGDSIVRELTGYDDDFVKRNSKIPEFQRELKNNILEKIKDLKRKKLIDKEGKITEKGFKLASLTLAIQELDKITPKDMFGDKISDKKTHYGEKDDIANYNSNHRYKDIAMRSTIKSAIRRGHSEISSNDLKIFTRKSKGSVYVIYGLDASGSMHGKKMEVAKKAGIALAHKAISTHDKVGLLVFNSEIKATVNPTDDFFSIVNTIAKVQASKETNLVFAIDKAIEMFPPGDATKHLLLMTDGVPTVGDKEDVFKAVARAKAHNITISVIGINLADGRSIAQKIAEYGEGRLYIIKNLTETDQIVLDDYYHI